MNIYIIGHGKSPLNKGWGPRIDEGLVVRLKNPSWQNKEDYGSRVDYMCSSCETLPVMLDYKNVPKEYWGQPKKGSWNATTEANFRSRAKALLKIQIDLHNKWNPIFLDLTDKDVPNHSLGMAAITYVAEILKPETIFLVGFDNLLDPSRLDYHKANFGKWVTRHDWFAENLMLPIIERETGVKIVGMG